MSLDSELRVKVERVSIGTSKVRSNSLTFLREGTGKHYEIHLVS